RSRLERARRTGRPAAPEDRPGPAAYPPWPGVPAAGRTVMAAPSLRARLLRAGLLGGVLVSLLAAGLLGEAFRVMAERAQVRALEHELAAVVGRLEADPTGRLDMPDPPAGPDYQRVFSGHYWQVGDDADGFASRSLWDFRAAFAQPATER